ncbi:hypothetical protein HQ585_19550 [candidate division KSB1 bacterium]|nr:hypothetical protein [candidate division KSB1 bacterium]
MQVTDLFLVFLQPLNKAKIKYMVTEAAGVILYGAPRMTHDLDLVLEISSIQAEKLALFFPEDQFYCPPREVVLLELGRPRRGHFNLIHQRTGFKADCYLMGDDPLHKWAMEHRNKLDYQGNEIQVAPPEYVIIRKLQYYQEGHSEKHLLDIRSILDISSKRIDRPRLERMLGDAGLTTLWSEQFPD